MVVILIAPVLLVADMLEPIHNFPIQAFMNRNMGHGRGWAGPMPVFLAGWKPNHISGQNLLERASPTLREATACRDNQGLTQWVRVPSRACSRLEGDAGPESTCWIVGLKQWVNPYRAGEPFGGACARGVAAVSFDFHDSSVFDLRVLVQDVRACMGLRPETLRNAKGRPVSRPSR
jgi:hypothetical protein